MRAVFHRIDLLRVALQVKGASPTEIEETLLALRKEADPGAFDAWNCQLSGNGEFHIMGKMLSPGGEILCGRFLSIFAKTFVIRFGLAPDKLERWFKAWFWGRN